MILFCVLSNLHTSLNNIVICNLQYNTVISKRQEVQKIKILLGRKQKSVPIPLIKKELVRFFSIKMPTIQAFSTYFLVRSSTVTASTCHELGWSITHSGDTATLGFLLYLGQNIVSINSPP